MMTRTAVGRPDISQHQERSGHDSQKRMFFEVGVAVVLPLGATRQFVPLSSGFNECWVV